MRPCATASAVFTGVLVAATLFAACSSGTTPPSPPESASPGASPPPASQPTGATESQPSAAAAPGAADQGTAASGAAAPSQPAAGRKKAPETVEDCKAIASEITNEPPDGGVVMNNATTSADAGSSDRLQPLVDAIKARRDGFRCCFDLYARKHPGAQGRVTWQLKLKPDGTFEEATIVRDKSDVTAPQVESCMEELARSVTWARSPSGKETVLTYPFDFKRRN
ncbi:MAG TPA: AgmX/PglI C-terminal domain-containing protein [Sorangium sp.]|uniref:AgmX/PglI C-terminal domain-containing protein n=1 Tax=Sorangium sp. So ce1153 TaxID=3133333 RepID=UPI002BD023AD|nr:AgmX/PglI C-terminal domain-containing protein [Sorangium sp.]